MIRESSIHFISPVGKWLRLPLSQKLTVLHVLLVALVVEGAIRLAPVAKLARWLGVPFRPGDEQTPGAPVDPPDLDDKDRRRARLTLAVMDHWPFVEGTCLRQSLVLGHFFRRHDPTLRLGVKREDCHLTAHAWIEVGSATLGLDESFLPFRRFV